MTTLREASLIALKFLEALGENHWLDRKATMAALREALAEPEPEPLCTAAMFDDAFLAKSGLSPDTKLYTAPAQQQAEPVAWMDREGDLYKMPEIQGWAPPHTLLYTHPPQRQPIDEKTLWEMWVESPSDVLRFARAIERAHGIGGEV